MNEEELACLNAISIVEKYINKNVKDRVIHVSVMQHVLDLKAFHCTAVGYRIIKESNNG